MAGSGTRLCLLLAWLLVVISLGGNVVLIVLFASRSSSTCTVPHPAPPKGVYYVPTPAPKRAESNPFGESFRLDTEASVQAVPPFFVSPPKKDDRDKCPVFYDLYVKGAHIECGETECGDCLCDPGTELGLYEQIRILSQKISAGQAECGDCICDCEEPADSWDTCEVAY